MCFVVIWCAPRYKHRISWWESQYRWHSNPSPDNRKSAQPANFPANEQQSGEKNIIKTTTKAANSKKEKKRKTIRLQSVRHKSHAMTLLPLCDWLTDQVHPHTHTQSAHTKSLKWLAFPFFCNWNEWAAADAEITFYSIHDNARMYL